MVNTVTPFLRDQLNFSQMEDNNGSNNANEDVNPQVAEGGKKKAGENFCALQRAHFSQTIF